VYELALFFHLVGAFCFFMGGAVAAIGQAAARKRTRPSEIALLLRVARRGVLLVAVGTLLVVGFGFWLIDLTRYGLDAWVVAALALLGFAMAAGGLGGRAPTNARRLADRLAQQNDEPSSELARLLNSRVADALNLAAAVAAIAILVLMVWKPGA